MTNRHLSVAISLDMLASLLSSISSMLLNDTRFMSDGIAMLSSLITHLNPSSNEDLLLAILDITRLEMRLGKLSIYYMPRVRGIAQRMHGVTIDHIIPLFGIASLDHESYLGVKSRYFAVDTALVNCDLLQLSGLLSSEETRQRALGIIAILPYTTSANRVYNTKNNPQNECPALPPHQPTTQTSNVTYPPKRGVPRKCIAAMMIEDKSFMGCHFNHLDDSTKQMVHQEVGFPALAKHGYICQKDVRASAKVVGWFNTKFP